MDRILKVERNYILGMIKKIRSTKCNILLVQKSILHKIEDVESEDIEFISKTLNCLPIILPQSTYTWKLSKISRLFPKLNYILCRITVLHHSVGSIPTSGAIQLLIGTQHRNCFVQNLSSNYE
jgi:hypothetical protein